MERQPRDIDDLIARYLAGEALPDQAAVLDAWINKSQANRKYFDQLKLIFQGAGSVTEGEQYDTDRAWQKVKSKLKAKGEARPVPLSDGGYGFRFIMRLAATVLLVVMAGVFTYRIFMTGSSKTIQVLADKQTASDTLPDGSDVFLNRKTKIEYSFNKKSNTHTARLQGEAYFNINHNEDKVFIVEAGGVLVKDIGTSFNVRAYPDATTVEVVVDEGEVMFYSAEQTGVILKAGGRGVYDKVSKTFTIAEPEPNITSYKTRFFSFSNHSLATVVATLNGVYNVKIEVDKKLVDCRLTVSFNDESIDEIVAVIAETLGLTVTRTGDVIRLEGSGCVKDIAG